MLQTVLQSDARYDQFGDSSEAIVVAADPVYQLATEFESVGPAQAQAPVERAADVEDHRRSATSAGLTSFEKPDGLEQLCCQRLNSPMYFRPDWRWLRAWLLAVKLDRPLADTDDDLVIRIAACLAGDMDRAFRTSLLLVCGLARLKASVSAQLQARLLANEGTSSIAARMNLSAEAVDLYHDVFFAVRPHLSCESIIRNAVFDEAFERSCQIVRFSDLVRLAAYRGGSAVLEDLLWYQRMPRPKLPKNPRTMSDEELEIPDRWYSLHRFVLVNTTVPKNEQERLQFAAIAMRQRY